MLHIRSFTLLLSLAASSFTVAGTCENAGACSSPCPAAGTCNTAADCGIGGVCTPYPEWPYCMPSVCHCEGSSWTCTDDCAGFCGIASPDIDADGIPDDVDNCPTVTNPSQSNCDGDFLGDACDACPCDAESDGDGDGVCGNIDNCRYVPNPSQANADADDLGDACDCGPLDPEAGTPLEVSTLQAIAITRSHTEFEWSPTARADRYDISLRSLTERANICWTFNDDDPTDTHFTELAVPASGDGWGYLVRGVDEACGGAGPWTRWMTTGICP